MPTLKDEDARLNENRRRQIMTLQHARARHEDAARRLQGLKRNQGANATAEEMLAQLEEEVRGGGRGHGEYKARKSQLRARSSKSTRDSLNRGRSLF